MEDLPPRWVICECCDSVKASAMREMQRNTMRRVGGEARDEVGHVGENITFNFNSVYPSRLLFKPSSLTHTRRIRSTPRPSTNRPTTPCLDVLCVPSAMPSRKKKQGRARKAKQAEINSSNPNKSSDDCTHFDCSRNSNWSRDDYDAANILLAEFELKYNALFADDRSRSEGAFGQSILALIEFVYDEYFQFSGEGKVIFKQILLAGGTNYCLSEAKEKDLTKETAIPSLSHFVRVMYTIEVRDSHGGALSDSIMSEIHILSNDTVSPRETIRFFHKRNSCDCLKELYYKLKENTKRTAMCYNCFELVDIRKMSQCECKIVNYCSYDCAVAHYPRHKLQCTQRKTSNSGSSNDIEKDN
eukprot:scaffold65279_cov48-Cyclotella_meneghiniana.AAC.1